MKFELKGNPNYAASIVEINNLIPLENCDNIQGTMIYGNHVIISKNIKIGDVGIFFPVETSIKDIFLKSNNLYRDKTLNIDSEKSGFFELNGRVRCMKLRGFKSEGFFIPIISILSFDKQWNDSISYNIGESFDYINDIMICEKYVIKTISYQNSTNKKQGKKAKIKLILDN